jgi:hypothetical protein
MSAIIGPAIQLAISLCGLIASQQAMSYIDELKEIQLALLAEEAKGDDADDGKIESLHRQLPILFQAVNEQYALIQKNPSITSSSAV